MTCKTDIYISLSTFTSLFDLYHFDSPAILEKQMEIYIFFLCSAFYFALVVVPIMTILIFNNNKNNSNNRIQMKMIFLLSIFVYI